MRAFPICLLALTLSGCSLLSRSPVEPVQNTQRNPKQSRKKRKSRAPLPFASLLTQKSWSASRSAISVK